ncbi:hypothetical protein GALL_366810 [mine drainage metagenome]|uniref:Uncharacterized protein n=1 Tax=mine drainage metagenome TaxID=410659 RepID=A0A1J5QVP8_9ZZZZ
MQITHLDAVFRQVIGQVFRHALGQGRDQHPLPDHDARPGFRQQIVDLGVGGPDLDLGVDQAGRAHHLLDHLLLMRGFVFRRRGGDEHALAHHLLEFIEPERPVIQR